MTPEQQRAMALASARRRQAEAQGVPQASPPPAALPSAEVQQQPQAPAQGEEKGLGRIIWENIVGDSDPTTQNFGEKLGTALNMAGESMTFGLVGDEASGAVAAAMPGGMDYAQRRDFERQQQRALTQSNPGMAIGAQIGGALVGPAGLATAAPRMATRAAALMNGSSRTGAVGRAVVAGGTAGAVQGGSEGEGGAARRLEAAGTGAALGGVLGGVSVPVTSAAAWAFRRGGKVLANLFKDRRILSAGEITEQGKEILKAAGFDADKIGAEFKEQFKRGVDEALTPADAAAAAELRQFGIPAYRHNVTGSATDFATFERGRRGALGSGVEAQIRSAADVQDRAMRAAGDGVATRIGGGVQAGQAEAAQGVMSALRNARKAAHQEAKAAYQAMDNIGGGVPGHLLKGLGSSLQNVLRMGGLDLDPALTPNAAGAVKLLDRLMEGADKGTVPFGNIERARQGLVTLRKAAARGASGVDGMAMGNLMDAFDGHIESVMDAAMAAGGTEFRNAAKNARGAWSSYVRTFEGKDGFSKFVQAMTDMDASPDQVVNWLFSAGRLGTGRMKAPLAENLKRVLGAESPEWNMIRQGAVRQMIENRGNATSWGPQKMASNITDFLTSPSNQDLVRQLFSADDVKLLRDYAGALRRMVPPAGAVNHSNTAYEQGRIVAQMARMVASAFGMTGGPVGGAIAAGAGAALEGGRGASAARALLSPPVQQRTTQTGVGALAAGAQGGNAGAFIANQQPGSTTSAPLGR